MLVETSSFCTITEIGLQYRRGRVGNWTAEISDARRQPEGFTYGIGVFARDRVDVVGCRVIYTK